MRNCCHRNKIYVLASLLKQIYLQPAVCTRIYCTVNMVCHSCCHHREFKSWPTPEHQCCYCGFEMTSQLLPLTLNIRTPHRPSNDAMWDLRHDLRRDLSESRWLSFVNTTWLRPGPSLKPSLESSLKSRPLVNTAPGLRFNIKMTSYQYRKSHCGDKTIWRPSYLHNGISYAGKMISLYWIGAQVGRLEWTSLVKLVTGIHQ